MLEDCNSCILVSLQESVFSLLTSCLFFFSSDTSVQLVPQNLKPGRTEVPMLIKDFQGVSCAVPQSLQLTVCKCADNGVCQEKFVGAKSVGLGPAAIALIILAFLLLLRE